MTADAPNNDSAQEDSVREDGVSEEALAEAARAHPVRFLKESHAQASEQALEATSKQKHRFFEGAKRAYEHVMEIFADTEWMPPAQTEEVTARIAQLGDAVLEVDVEGEPPEAILAALEEVAEPE